MEVTYPCGASASGGDGLPSTCPLHGDACGADARDAVLREHGEFGGLFQPGGRFHKRANLRLGGSAVRDGGKWLVEQLDAAEARIQSLQQDRDALHAQLADCHARLAGVCDDNQRAEAAAEAREQRLREALVVARAYVASDDTSLKAETETLRVIDAALAPSQESRP